MLRNPGGQGGAAFDPSALEAAIAALQELGLAVYYKDDISFSTTATPTLLGTVPTGKRFVSLGFIHIIDTVGGTFTPTGTEITVLCGSSSGASDIYFGFFNSNVVTAGKAAVYGGSAVAGGTAPADAGDGIYVQFNNAGITGGGTASGTVICWGLLIDPVD